VPNGTYVIGAAVCDFDDNYTDKSQSTVTVTVANGLPTVSINSPEDGSFFCVGDYFCADADAGDGCPIETVQFQYKSAFDSPDGWTDFDNGPDQQAPWCAELADDTEDPFFETDGWYDFRAVVTNTSGVSVASDKITLYYDGTAPRAMPVSATDGETTWDIENGNDPAVVVPMGTQMLTFTLFVADDQSPDGSTPAVNSGIAKICLSGLPETDEVCLDVTPDENGYVQVPWDISGLMETGNYELEFTIWDNACSYTTVSVEMDLVDPTEPSGLIAGCWNGRVYGMTWANQEVLFEQSTDGGANWVPIGVAHATDETEHLLLPSGAYTSKSYEVYWAEWKPADGDYMLRMRVDGGDIMPALGITVADGACSVTSNPQDYGPGTIERNKENGCDNLEGLGRFGTAYGMPYGIAVAYNVPEESWSYDIIQFYTLPQQGDLNEYAGAFQFWALTEGGFGWGHLFFFDHDDAGEVAYSAEAHYQTFWVTRDFGTGGPVWFADHTVSVDVPAEATDNTGTDENSLAMWKTPVVRPSIYQDFYFTPVGDNNGMMTYISDPSCNDICLDDNQYAIINMQYDNNETTDPSKLAVARWDGEGHWLTQNIFFPSTVRRFYQQDGQNWVEFAVDCFGGSYDGSSDAWYAVVKKTQYDGDPLITRHSMYPDCDGFTSSWPDIYYQVSEAFATQINYNSLEIWLDGYPIHERNGYYVDTNIVTYKSGVTSPSGMKNAIKLEGTTTLSGNDDGDAWIVDVYIDPVANWVEVYFPRYDYYWNGDSYTYDYSTEYPAIDCGEHVLKLRVEDYQNRPQYIMDTLEVDCQAPDVNFNNYYTAKDPTIEFTITDDQSGVSWDGVYVDVFFVTKANNDGTNGTPNETVEFVQTFFPGQIKDYLQEDGETVRIPTSYDLENRRALIAVVYDGSYSHQLSVDLYSLLSDLFSGDLNGSINFDDPSFYDAFDYYYAYGAYDCAGNYTTPHVQYLPIDTKAPTYEVNDASVPIRIRITDDGSGLDPNSIQIYSEGELVTSEPQTSAGAVDQPGEWYFETTNDGGILWYYPTGDYEIRFADMSGNVVEVTGNGGGSITDGSVSGWAGPNPYDPAMDGNLAIHYSVGQGKVNTVTCTIFDQMGDKVTSLAPQSSASGVFNWNGETDGGRMVANGVYFAVIQAQGSGGSSAVVKIAVVEK
jgi:hypothetical protein